MSIKFSSIPPKRLLAGITSASTSFYLNNILSFDGLTNVASTDLGTQHYCAFRNDTGTILELMEIDPATISAGPVTILRRGLSFYGDRTTETTALKLDWPSNSIVMLGTDVPQIFQYLKEYIDAASIAGAVPASTTAAGIVVEASQAEVDAGTGTKVVSAVTYDLFAKPNLIRAKKYHDAVASATGTDAYAITIVPAITAYATYQEFTFIADVANTGACTLNVSGLGAKSIVKGVSTALDTGDILAGQTVKVMYDGTNMQLLSVSSVSPSKINVQTFTASGTYTKPTFGTPLKVFVQAWGGGGSGAKGSNGGGGAGGGAYIEKWFDIASIGATETVTIGAGGSAQSSADSSGSDGGNTTFGSLLTAYGGKRGLYTSGVGTGGGGGGQTSIATDGSDTVGGTGGSPIGGVGTGAGIAAGTSLFGGGAGSCGGASVTDGGLSHYGGGGGQGADSNSANSGKGGNSTWGGGGGGGAGTTTSGGTGGTSLFGGDGGAGAVDASNATAGTQPAGGGGGSETGTSGAGGSGKMIVTTFF